MAKLRSSNIEPSTGTTLALGASGDAALISSDSIKANTWQDLGGNSLWVSDGAGTLSNVNSSLAGGGYTLISTSTATGEASIEITSGIDNTYDEYVFVFTNINPVDNSTEFQFQMDAAGTSYNTTMTTTSWCAYNQENGGGQGFFYDTGQDQAQGTSLQTIGIDIGNGADEMAAGTLHLFNLSSTTYQKHFYSRFQEYQANDTSQEVYTAGYFNTTAALTKIKFLFTSGNFDGTIQMYGVA